MSVHSKRSWSPAARISKTATIRLLLILCVLIAIQHIFYSSVYCDSTGWNNVSYQSFVANLVPASTYSNKQAPAYYNKVPILDKRTAVVVTLSHVDECEAVRLRHLVDTSGLEVWVLHGHKSLQMKKPQLVQQSETLISEIAGLQSWPQSTRPIENFDSKVSGATKSSFLRFLIAHEQYDFAWHVESDVFMTGKWDQVLVTTEDSQSDLIFTKAWDKTTDTGWWDRVSQGKCKVDGNDCKDILPLQTYWMTTRASRSLATALIESLEKGQAIGHHEGIIAAFCEQRGFVRLQLDKKWIGDPFKAGSIVPWGERAAEKRTNTLARAKQVHPNKMYHPVKCVAYTTASVMQAEVDQWLR